MSTGYMLGRPSLLLSRKASSVFACRQSPATRNYMSILARRWGVSAWVTRGPAWGLSEGRCLVPDVRTTVIFPSRSPRVRTLSSYSRDETIAETEDYESGKDTEEADPSAGRIKLNRRDPLFDKVNLVIDIPIGTLHSLDISFTCVDLMVDCCKLQTLEGMKYARDMLDRILAEKKHVNKEILTEGRQPLVIPAKSFEKFLYGWATMAKHVEVAVPRMKEVIELMAQEDEYDKQVRSSMSSHLDEVVPIDKKLSCQPTVYTFNVILRGLAEASRRSPDLAFEAESLLDAMVDHHATRGWHTKPNTRSFTHVMTAFANSQGMFAGSRAEQLLERMKDMHEVEKEKYAVEFGSPYDMMDPKRNIIQIVTPDRFVYSAVISAHANSGALESAEKAHSLLLELVERKGSHVRPDAALFTSAINAWANAASTRKSGKGRYEAAEHAEELLLMMIDMAEHEHANRKVSPEWASDDEEWDEEETEEKDHKRISVSPNIISFNSVLNAWAKSDTREAAPRAEALLQKMLEASMTDDAAVRPDCVSFNSVLNAWARYSSHDAEAPQKAEDLLNLMYDLYHSGRLDENAKPDTTSYTSVINAWAKGGADHEKAANARRLLDAMLHKFEAGEHNVKPNVTSFTSVLNAAAHSPPSSLSVGGVSEEDGFTDTSGSADPYTIALQTYEELWNDYFDLKVKPDHFAFAAMLSVVGRHTEVTSAERRQMVERIFDDACASGQVSTLVVKAVEDACPSIDLLERLMGSRKLARHMKSINELPRDWTRKIGGTKRFRLMDFTKRQGRSDGRKPRGKRPRQTKTKEK